MKKPVRSRSGVVNVSVVMPPHRFSCAYDCRMCPDQRISNGAEEDMPRSYLSNEDAVRRAASVDFDPCEQVRVRLRRLKENGHAIDKVEVRVLGGTFSSYPRDVADTFIRDVYYAANTFYDTRIRPPHMLAEEQEENESSRVRIVGMGLETRPDAITIDEIRRFREYGCTRAELGVQHTDDRLLRIINRGHGSRHSRRAIRMLKDHGFKIELHIMTDMPGATPEGDKECYREILTGTEYVPDYLKDYPCLAVDFSEIKAWREDGRWKPYSEDEDGAHLLKDVLVYRQSITPPWVRTSRIQRDFAMARSADSGAVVLGYHSGSILPNLGQLVREEAARKGVCCQCIRCHEVRDICYDDRDVVIVERRFEASGATEYFISAEVLPGDPMRRLVIGFARLRVDMARNRVCALPQVAGNGVALLRELHVYGFVVPIEDERDYGGNAQHRGYGSRLLARAERLAIRHGCNTMAVISGVGARGYYRKKGYVLDGTYMVKDLPVDATMTVLSILILLLALGACLVLFYRPGTVTEEMFHCFPECEYILS